MKAIVLVGNITEGYTHVGPFENFDDAAHWCDVQGHDGQGSWVATLYTPDDLKRRECVRCGNQIVPVALEERGDKDDEAWEHVHSTLDEDHEARSKEG